MRNSINVTLRFVSRSLRARAKGEFSAYEGIRIVKERRKG
jgi:hypothetical protein